MTDGEYRAQELAAYKKWQADTEQLPLSEFGRIASEPSTILPARGGYYIVANNLEELTAFLCKIEDLSAWNQVVKDVYVKYDDDDELESNEAWIESQEAGWETREVRTIKFNEFYDFDQRLHVTKATMEVRKPAAIVYRDDFLTDVTFPCLVQNSADGGYDRIGDWEMKHCQVMNLPGMAMRTGPVQYVVNWL